MLESGAGGMGVDDERENKLIGELRDGFHAVPEDRAVAVIDSIQIVEEFRRSHVAGDAEADAIGERTIGCKKNAAVVIPDGLVAFWLAERRPRSATEQN